MTSRNHKLRLIGSLATLALLAIGVACTGFFVNPTISSLAVGPASPTIETGTTGNTVQMTVFGTNSDGSTTSSPSVSWSITPTSVATISNAGLVTSASTGTATVTATSNQNPSITGTQSVTVTVGCIQSIAISPTSGPPLTTNAPFDSFTAQATTCNGVVDVTSVATWTSSNTSLATVSAGTVTMVTGNTTSGTVSITAAIGNITSTAVTITVSP
jgi:Big-like domain-containing protein